MPHLHQDHHRTPDFSVIIPSYRSWPHIGRCLEALHQFGAMERGEVVVADSSGDGTCARVAEAFPEVHVVDLRTRTLPGPARDAAIQTSRGAYLALLDSDCVPTDGWLDAVVEGARRGLIQGGPILNGTPQSSVGTAEHIFEFSEYHPAGPARSIRMMPTCNLALPRADYRATGGFAAVQGTTRVHASEDVLFCHRLRELGRDIRFCPSMGILHVNRTDLSAYLKNQKILGKGFVHSRGRAEVPGSWLATHPLAPFLAPHAKLVRVAGRYFIYGGAARRDLLRHLPLVTLGAYAFGAGVWAAQRDSASSLP